MRGQSGLYSETLSQKQQRLGCGSGTRVPCKYKALDSTLSTTQRGVVVHTIDFSSWEAEAGGLKIQGHRWPQSELCFISFKYMTHGREREGNEG